VQFACLEPGFISNSKRSGCQISHTPLQRIWGCIVLHEFTELVAPLT